MKRKPPELSEEDKALWQQMTQHITPLARTRQVRPVASEVAACLVRVPRVRPAPLLPPPAEKMASGQETPWDKGIQQRLRQGRYALEATLDLHGHTQADAYGKLSAFLHRHYLQGVRCLLVITGKGRAATPSVLREQLPHWLEAPALRSMVLAFAPAKPHHGGDGAWYILLKRKR